jgi:serine/threonine protein phosphatase 1
MVWQRHPHRHRLFAVGDIHGCVEELALMIKTIAPARGDTVVFVGDYIDRGPCSRETIDVLIELQRGEATTVFLKGNHEDMMLNFMGLPGHYGESFLINGGAQTLESYAVEKAPPAEVGQMIPAPHLDFFKSLRDSHLERPYLFVHAGIMPGVPLAEQSEEDLLWIRHQFIFNPHQLGMTVVFGHTPMRTVMIDPPYKMGIDTGLVYGGKLSCVELSEGVLYQVGRGSRQVKKSALELS